MLINPEILEFSEDTTLETEWCLSVPWVKWDVARSNRIKLQYQDSKRTLKTIYLEWLQARIIQHELDHINGKLFIDYLN
jgi:peptide deformylase